MTRDLQLTLARSKMSFKALDAVLSMHNLAAPVGDDEGAGGGAKKAVVSLAKTTTQMVRRCAALERAHA